MKNFITPSRYAFFALFVIFNAVICTAAVWNFGIAKLLGRALAADVYLAIMSAFAMIFFFVITLVEMMRQDAVTTRVWFECLWVGVFCLLELGGAVTITAIGPPMLCEESLSATANNACTSTRVVMAFTWLCTLFSLGYLLVLSIAAFICSRDDPSVWDAAVRRYRWQDMCREIKSCPNSPTLPRFISKPALIKAPQPRRPAPKDLYLAHRSGISAEYKIEHYQPKPAAATTTDRTVLPAPSSRAPEYMRQLTRDAPTLYPQHMETYAPTPPPKPVSQQPSQGPLPRANAATESSRSKRKEVPAMRESAMAPAPSTSQAPVPRRSGSTSSTYVPRRSASISSTYVTKQSPTRTKNTSGSGDWRDRVVIPPPLDLSKISNNRPRN